MPIVSAIKYICEINPNVAVGLGMKYTFAAAVASSIFVVPSIVSRTYLYDCGERDLGITGGFILLKTVLSATSSTSTGVFEFDLAYKNSSCSEKNRMIRTSIKITATGANFRT
jgi:hypothetical protein